MILPILGHEFMGMVEDIESKVKNLRKGDQKKKTPHEEIFLSFSGVFGYSHVTQYVRVPFAETNKFRLIYLMKKFYFFRIYFPLVRMQLN